jgi:hypothetical protein
MFCFKHIVKAKLSRNYIIKRMLNFMIEVEFCKVRTYRMESERLVCLFPSILI